MNNEVKNGIIPSSNKEFWILLRGLPYHLQFFVAVVLIASVIGIPNGVYSFVRNDGVRALTDSLAIRVDNIEHDLFDHAKQNNDLVARVDSVAGLVLRYGESLDFLWCLNEKSELPEVRTYCGELRDDIRDALKIRAGVAR